jgi:predicted small lipoprotein YifL
MHCWARYLFILVVAVLGIGQMIAACGQKGDLYLPEPASSTNSAKEGTVQPAPQGGTEEKRKVQSGQ